MLVFGFPGLFGRSFAFGAVRAGLSAPNDGGLTFSLEMKVGVLFELVRITDNLTPAVGGVGAVDRGLGFVIGASDGCGGGVAR